MSQALSGRVIVEFSHYVPLGIKGVNGGSLVLQQSTCCNGNQHSIDGTLLTA